jgi:putative hydrolase of the HAD superfamily
MPAPEAILIDLDDTIIDDNGCVDSCWHDAVTEAASSLNGFGVQDLRAAIDRQAAWYWSDPARHRAGRLDLRACTASIVAEAFAPLGISDASMARRTAEHYRDLREERAQLFPGALTTLDHLRSLGCKLGLMTNGAGPAQRAKLERFGLTGYFEHIVIEGEFGAGKPDERVFQSLLSVLRVDSSKTWAVGDNLDFDVRAAMRLGIFGVWVNPLEAGSEDGHPAPDRVISSIEQLIE